MNKLIQASENGDVEIVRLLLETGENRPGHTNNESIRKTLHLVNRSSNSVLWCEKL